MRSFFGKNALAILVGSGLMLPFLLAAIFAGLTFKRLDSTYKPAMSECCDGGCVVGCKCGDCLACTTAAFPPAQGVCKCGPVKGCDCKPTKGCSCPSKSSSGLVNVICCFCRRNFAATANTRSTYCPHCNRSLIVDAGKTGEVGEVKK
jgi:hypothetical protein